jgi:hypothetical protein
MAGLAAAHLFSFNPNADLHGGAMSHIPASFQGEKIAYVHRPVKVNPFNGGGNHVGPGIPGGNDKGGIIYKLHNDSAVNITGRIGMIGHHDVGNYCSTKCRIGTGCHWRISDKIERWEE